jgi:hypothetical protein
VSAKQVMLSWVMQNVCVALLGTQTEPIDWLQKVTFVVLHIYPKSDQQYVPLELETDWEVQLYPSKVKQYWAKLLKQERPS